MDNNNIPSDFNDWLNGDEFAEDIGTDEVLFSDTKVVRPEDIALERILSENWDTEPGENMEPAEDAAPPEPESAEPAENGRKKRARSDSKEKSGLFGIPHLLTTGIWLGLILICGVLLGRVLWVCCTDVMAFGKTPQQVTITIAQGDDLNDVAKKLSDAELIRYPKLFKLFVRLSGKEDRISVGSFALDAKFDYNAMVNAMGAHAASREEVSIMFPEGYNCAQIFALLEEKNVCSAEELGQWAANGELEDYWFLEGVERGTKYCLEGYLFPDTYSFYTHDEPKRVLEKFLSNFDKRFTDLMKERLEKMQKNFADKLAANGYEKAYIEANKLTIRDIVIIASLIEKETAGADESYTISSVIYNRLTSSSEPHFLNIDASLVYALNGNIDPVTGQSKPLTENDKKLDTPYNTYLYTGLIPTPIANPGRDCLNAALEPEDTRYLYYALDPVSGNHHFSKTYSEHTAFLSKLG